MTIQNSTDWGKVERKARKFEKYYEIARCSIGYVIRPIEKLDNTRWYFEHLSDAQEAMNYLERTLVK